MNLIILLTLFSILWKNDFTETQEGWVSDPKNPVEITHILEEDSTGYVFIQGEPEDVGRSSAWLYIEELSLLDENSYLSIRTKGNENLLRIRVFFKKKGKKPYYHLTKFVNAPKEWTNIEIYLKDANAIWSSNYPDFLTPSLSPDFFLFVENGEPGSFSVYIDKLEIMEEEK